MEFKKSFTEAAQQAILVKLADGTWENLPWLAQHVQDVISDSVAAMLVTTEGVMQPIDLSGKAIPRNAEFSSKKTQFVDWEGKEVPADREATSGKSDDEKYFTTSEVAEMKFPQYRTDIKPEVLHSAALAENSSSFKSEDFSWQPGFPYKILVSSRDKDRTNGYAMHYRERPSQEEFNSHYQLFRNKTHYVHILQSDGEHTSNKITEEFTAGVREEKPVETFTATDEWPEGKTHRIKFHDQRIAGDNYVYFDYRPTGYSLQKYHNKKGFAVVQQRPEGV